MDDRPAQVGIDLEAGEDFDAVQQAAHDGEMLGGAGGVDERMCPGQLEVAARRRGIERPERMIRESHERRILIRRIAIDEDGRDRLGQEVLDDADVGFAVDVLED